MKILLVSPDYPDTFWSFKHALKMIQKKAALPPLGLATVAAMLPASWEKKLVDMSVAKAQRKRYPLGGLCFYQRDDCAAGIHACHHRTVPCTR